MALPTLNETPKYELTLPSTGKKIKFRPYLVKEEKILMLAAETKDPNQIMDAIIDTVSACVSTKLDVSKLTTFDLEYLFIKLRAKSVGEKVSLSLKCKSCEHDNEYEMDLDSIVCDSRPNNSIIELDDKVSVQMRYPSYVNLKEVEDEGEMGFNILASSLEAVYADDERIDMEDETEESIRRFLESMTREQFKKVSEFLMDIPKVSYDIDFDCTKCGEHTHIELRGIQDFF
jgi:ribosomal protein L44E